MAFFDTIASIAASTTPNHIFTLASIALVATLAYHICVYIYNIYLHPLSKYPGPRFASASSFWLVSSYFGGKTPYDLLELHNKYGPVVRTSPDGLSYIKAPQWKEIYGHKTGQLEFAKDEKYFAGLKGEPIILTADRHYHGYIRKLFANGFSEKALREQESVLKGYVDLMFRRIEEEGQDGKQPVDILKWYNFVTFDFIGFLTFGESFDCLNTSTLHTWVKIFFSLAKFFSYHQMLSRFPKLFRLPIALFLIPPKVISDGKTLKKLQVEKVKHRLQNESTVPDFMDKMIAAYHSGKMSFDQLEGNSQILIAAGSETTATMMSGFTYLLTKNPRVLEKLSAEIRSTFSNPDEVTFTAVNSCKYLLACIEEALRVYPPSPQPHHRIVPPGGATVNGDFLPAGVSVSIPIYAASNSPENWTRPEEFLPERWLGENPEFEDDQRDASQPFQYGPRACIGRNLAYAEIKLIIARLVLQFDISNATGNDWMESQKVFMVWEKSPLWIKLQPVRR
ncbi:hypothetical protein CkaCkLH20_05658 [Colletotrichum karsti]|uniref:Cytochrome P450 n=1 Tax=Colletotrichum karsti TaxID=1095194 RepID=A0A9P6LLQ0_9PEZI|nr:uncharacterized protein CkaCkLH20_05658 [Colletotrichum karsti]KAF9876812.1 hypothetical protein CkaCkLH20_05658 [Colletotrichum karsti]